jgi:DNA-directed RNA polymerase subunit M/transcription elongation factor TFIIS
MGFDPRNPDRSETQPTSKPTEPACERCGGQTKLWTQIARFGDQPAYSIYRCASCDNIHWVMRDGE